MSALLITILAITFLFLLFLNFYFRAKVLGAYKRLVQNEVAFSGKYIFDKKALESDVLPRYPKNKQDILDFVNNIRKSIRMASVFIVLIIILAWLLLKFN